MVADQLMEQEKQLGNAIVGIQCMVFLKCIRFYYRPRSLAKQGDNMLGSVHPCVCVGLCVHLFEPIDL